MDPDDFIRKYGLPVSQKVRRLLVPTIHLANNGRLTSTEDGREGYASGADIIAHRQPDTARTLCEQVSAETGYSAASILEEGKV